jgi:photosynthetic reaction center cytochrome c subunit
MHHRAFALFFVLLAAGLSTPAQSFQGPPRGKPEESNIQVLKTLPEGNIHMTMNYIATSLGVRCSHCHVSDSSGWHWPKDDKPQKRTARKMMQMVMDINTKTFGGRNDVTCYTCHRGSTEPTAIMPLPQPAPKPRKDEAAAPPALPTADQVLASYETALGGTEALAKIKNRVTTGVSVDWQGKENPVEITQAAPNKLVSAVTTKDRGLFTHGFDGTTGWMSSQRGARELPPDEIADLKDEAALFPIAKIRGLAKTLHVSGKETLNGSVAYLLESPAGENVTERFYVDSANGLLLRNTTITSTPIADIPAQVEYSDYRAVDGVKIPFTVQSAAADVHEASTLRITTVTQNVSIDEKKFSMPKAKK